MRPARVHEQIKLKQRSRDPTEGTSMRGRTVQDSSHAKGKTLKRKKKKKRRQQSQQKGLKIFGSSRRWEPNIITDPWLLNQKPEGEGIEESRGCSESLNIEGENEERILTTKSSTSQNPSTSVISDKDLVPNTDKIKKKHGTEDMDKGATDVKSRRYSDSSCSLQGSIFEGRVFPEKMHWEPPDDHIQLKTSSGQSKRQE